MIIKLYETEKYIDYTLNCENENQNRLENQT